MRIDSVLVECVVRIDGVRACCASNAAARIDGCPLSGQELFTHHCHQKQRRQHDARCHGDLELHREATGHRCGLHAAHAGVTRMEAFLEMLARNEGKAKFPPEDELANRATIAPEAPGLAPGGPGVPGLAVREPEKPGT